MADLGGVAKRWFLDAELQKKMALAGGIGGCVITKGSNAIVLQDRWHAVVNRKLIEPGMDAMRVQHIMKTPAMGALEEQVFILHLLFNGVALNVAAGLPTPPPDMAVPIHCAATSIKKLVSFVRRMRLRQHTPQDTVFRSASNAETCNVYLRLQDPDFRNLLDYWGPLVPFLRFSGAY